MKAINIFAGLALANLPFLIAANAQEAGSKVYAENCASCHQASGGGVPFMQPPLGGSKFVVGDDKALIEFVLIGSDARDGEDSEYENVMAGFGFLSDEELANVLTFIRANFGNDGAAISAKQVDETRRTLASKK